MSEVALNDDERQPCEIYSRVMGYHRPVKYWNHGKRNEHRDRVFFREALCKRITDATPA